MIRFIENAGEKEEIAKNVLEDLPEWFGLPESTAEYIRRGREMPFFADIEGGEARGFAALNETSPFTAEIYVMGVRKKFHRLGVGRELFGKFLDYAKERGYEFVQVKTVRQGCYKEYDMTAAFYKSLGFKELECFPTLWDEWNPCQVYVMAVR